MIATEASAVGGDPAQDLADELVAGPGWPGVDRVGGDGDGLVEDQLAQQAPGRPEPQGARQPRPSQRRGEANGGLAAFKCAGCLKRGG
jgi:hypothetical protein